MRSFFEGCAIEEVLLVMNSASRASGEGFVRFKTAEDGARALMRDRDLMIKRYVEVRARAHARAKERGRLHRGRREGARGSWRMGCGTHLAT